MQRGWLGWPWQSPCLLLAALLSGPPLFAQDEVPTPTPAGGDREQLEEPQVLTQPEAEAQIAAEPASTSLQPIYDSEQAQKELEGRDYTVPTLPAVAPAPPDAPGGEFDPKRKKKKKKDLLPRGQGGEESNAGDDDDDADADEDDD